jgi:hypothetical protein
MSSVESQGTNPRYELGEGGLMKKTNNQTFLDFGDRQLCVGASLLFGRKNVA